MISKSKKANHPWKKYGWATEEAIKRQKAEEQRKKDQEERKSERSN